MGTVRAEVEAIPPGGPYLNGRALYARGFWSGVIGATVMVALIVLFSWLFGLETLMDRLQQISIKFLPGQFFEYGIQHFGQAAKPIQLAIIALVIILFGGILGVLYVKLFGKHSAIAANDPNQPIGMFRDRTLLRNALVYGVAVWVAFFAVIIPLLESATSDKYAYRGVGVFGSSYHSNANGALFTAGGPIAYSLLTLLLFLSFGLVNAFVFQQDVVATTRAWRAKLVASGQAAAAPHPPSVGRRRTLRYVFGGLTAAAAAVFMGSIFHQTGFGLGRAGSSSVGTGRPAEGASGSSVGDIQATGGPTDTPEPDTSVGATNTPQSTSPLAATNTALPATTNTALPAATNTALPATNTALPAATNTTTSAATNTALPVVTNTTTAPATNTALPVVTNTTTAPATHTALPAATAMPPSPTPAPAPTATPLALSDAGMPPEVTSNRTFYHVSKNSQDPIVSRDGWTLAVQGLVDHPYSLTYAQLAALPTITRYLNLSCISNPVGGNLIGSAKWRGVPLTSLLQKAGVQSGAKRVVFKAADDYTDSITVDVAMHSYNLLALGMNNVDLPDDHGAPARLLIPGIYGMKNVKWLNTIILSDDAGYKGFWQAQGWDNAAPTRTMSILFIPQRDSTQPNQPMLIGGIAYAGDRGISKVEVSADGGQSWHRANLRTPKSPYSWVLWTWSWTPNGPGQYTIQTRATDKTGTLQRSDVTDAFPNGVEAYDTAKVTIAN